MSRAQRWVSRPTVPSARSWSGLRRPWRHPVLGPWMAPLPGEIKARSPILRRQRTTDPGSCPGSATTEVSPYLSFSLESRGRPSGPVLSAPVWQTPPPKTAVASSTVSVIVVAVSVVSVAVAVVICGVGGGGRGGAVILVGERAGDRVACGKGDLVVSDRNLLAFGVLAFPAGRPVTLGAAGLAESVAAGGAPSRR